MNSFLGQITLLSSMGYQQISKLQIHTYAPQIEKLSALAEMKYKSPLIALYISRIPHQ